MKTFLANHLKAEVTSNPQILKRFSDIFNEEILPKGSFFLKEKQTIRKLGILLEGVMRIYLLDESGIETNLLFITPGRSVSGNFLPFGTSGVYIQCITNVRLMVAGSDDLTALLEENELLKTFLYKTLNGAHQHVLNKLTQYIRMNAMERYLFFLQEYPGLVNMIPHYQIANYLGITATQLSRIRKVLAKNESRDKDSDSSF